MTAPVLQVDRISKTFTLHLQGGVSLPVLRERSLELRAGECVALVGASGSGKSTFMRALYGNYGVDRGAIVVQDGDDVVDVTALTSQELAALRTRTIGYVSQFLRVIPRVPALEIAMEPLLTRGTERAQAQEVVTGLFRRLDIPERMWQLSPTTFSGGEKQRINLARTLAVPYPILLLDEPTSALDAASRERVIALLLERKAAGAAMVGIFHDDEVRSRLADRTIPFGDAP
ncbi:MAG TPA: phosphonate C-P lyase system protein PhnL [Candidatus Elarobacter sp.]